MTTQEIMDVFKTLIVKSYLNDDPSLSEQRLAEIRIDVESRISPESPLSSVGLDSMKMTWIVVKLEEQYDIDASGVSFFELFSVNDLLNEILNLVKAKGY